MLANGVECVGLPGVCAQQISNASWFLPTAERFELIQGIDRWVIDRVTRLLHEERATGHSFAVNVSGVRSATWASSTSSNRSFRPHLGCAGRLTIEITETATVADLSVAAVFAREVRRLGCHVALDDLGVEFGSFAYLKHLPFDSAKIDGDFVRQCTANPTDRLIIEAIVGVAKGLGRASVAEFVEDAASVEYLRAAGVDYGQGYHISRPLPIDEALAFHPI